MRIKEVAGRSALAEMHYSDFYPASFEQFRKKYAKIVKAGQGDALYVQFTNHVDNTLDRTAFQDPDHNDMVGIYGYPLDYVLSHPADIWYGRNARYLRVLQSHSRKALLMQQHLTDDRQCVWLLKQMGFDPDTVWSQWDEAAGYIPKGVNHPAKTFLFCVQHDMTNPDHPPRSGAEQTALFRRAGFDAVYDTARKNTQAVINDREPEQICFLTRAAFRVLEVVDLRGGWAKEKLAPLASSNDPSGSPMERKIVALIAAQMGDRLVSGPANIGGDEKYYWTQAGRRIEIQIAKPLSYYQNKGFMQKPHRQDKLTDANYIHVKVQTENGPIYGRLDHKGKVKELLADVASEWAEIQATPKPVNTRFEPETREGYYAKQKAAEDAKFKAEWEAKNAKTLAKLPTIFEDIRWVADHYGLPFDPPTDDQDRLQFYYCLKDTRYTFSPDQMTDGMTPGDAFRKNSASFRKDAIDPIRPQLEQLADLFDAVWPDLQALGEREVRKFIEWDGECFTLARQILSKAMA